MDDVLLLPEAHWTFLLGPSLSGLGEVQEAGLEDSMEGSAWASSWHKTTSQSKGAGEVRRQKTEEASRGERRERGREGGRAGGPRLWEGQGSKISRAFCLGLGMPDSWLPAAGEWHS